MPSGYDAHAHLDAVGPELDRAIAASRAAGVTGWCVAAADPADWGSLRELATRVGAQVALGLHPWFADRDPRPALDALDALPPPDAVGEIGLDRAHPGFAGRQRDALRAQLAWARQRDLPVVLHCVRAHAELLAVLRSDGLSARGGLVHGWTADAPALAPFLALGLHVSFGRHVLVSARALRAACATPLDRLLFESDAPSGGAEPAAIPAFAARVAAARALDAHALLERAGANARALYGVAA